MQFLEDAFKVTFPQLIKSRQFRLNTLITKFTITLVSNNLAIRIKTNEFKNKKSLILYLNYGLLKLLENKRHFI